MDIMPKLSGGNVTRVTLTVLVFVALVLAAGTAAVSATDGEPYADNTGDSPSAVSPTDTDTFDFGVELQQTASVEQGGDVDITTWVNNRASQSVNDVTTEIRVDIDGDGNIGSGDTVAQTVRDYGGGNYTEVNLSYTDVQLQPGKYDYISLVKKGGNAQSSFTVGTLEVTPNNDDGGDSGSSTSPVSGVSDELWTAVTGDGSLSLGDLGGAIQGYQQNEQVNGVDISLGDLGALIQHYQA